VVTAGCGFATLPAPVIACRRTNRPSAALRRAIRALFHALHEPRRHHLLGGGRREHRDVPAPYCRRVPPLPARFHYAARRTRRCGGLRSTADAQRASFRRCAFRHCRAWRALRCLQNAVSVFTSPAVGCLPPAPGLCAVRNNLHQFGPGCGCRWFSLHFHTPSAVTSRVRTFCLPACGCQPPGRLLPGGVDYQCGRDVDSALLTWFAQNCCCTILLRVLLLPLISAG